MMFCLNNAISKLPKVYKLQKNYKPKKKTVNLEN